ncbi:MAG: alpha/beta fold hydrolase [Cytophagia bacterium]|nr:MAG: alpha/beta fold hydrolase [Runella sp.]TAG21241.1 MAG: alpha/beta fold hydrolase [Cytophagales bacterium]TAG40332.1 MAG: alpha/beta fold hydrolase [Cytophagia bacterium]TAG58422.1 MAG: alpha/beta fold hydrolase [Runella slithyformis]TAG81891.1 MAG: alpha/beta fold hydrolase [Cytophagales bacterium]
MIADSHFILKPQSVFIPSRDGFLLSALLFEPICSKGVVQISIGTGMKKEFYQHFAQFIAEQNYTVCLWEYRGMGQSRPNDVEVFKKISLQDWALLDAGGVLDFLEKRYPDLPKMLIGHSIGGQLLGFMSNHSLLRGAILVTSSTGTWWRHTFPYRFKSFYFFNILPLLLLPFYGYLACKRFNIMEDLPGNMIREWRKWCNSENYCFDFLGKTWPKAYFNEIRLPIKSYWVTDDPIANAHTVLAFTRHFSRADVLNESVVPADYGKKQIGHFGLFSRQMRDTFWRKIVNDLDHFATEKVRFNNPDLRKTNI